MRNEDLPDAIKNSLPAAAQDIYRNAFNSAFDKNKDDARASQIAWGAVKNAGWEKDSKNVWHKKHAELIDVEIFSTGIHNGDSYTEKDLDDIAKNFYELKDEIKPPMKLGHKGDIKSDGQPAMGWAQSLKRIGEKLYATFSDVPPLVAEAIKKKLYKRVSSEIYWNYPKGEKNYNRVLRGVALLGSDIPVVKNLQDVELLFSDDGNNNDIHIVEYQENNEENIMDNEKILKEYQEKIDKLTNEIHTQAQESKEYKEKFEKISLLLAEKNKAQKKAEFDSQIKLFNEKVEEYVKNGMVTPASRDIIKNHMEVKKYSENTDLSIPISVFSEFLDKNVAILDKKERVMGGNNPEPGSVQSTEYSEKYGAIKTGVDIDAAVKKYMKENQCKNYSEAFANVLASDEKLAEAWIKEGA